MSTDGAGGSRVLGVDFSGGKRAGNKIWIAEGTCTDTGVAITSCRTIVQITECSPEREVALAALVKYLGGQGEVLAGLDFPFSLPVELAARWSRDNWDTFVRGFAAKYDSKESARFHSEMHAPTEERERREPRKPREPRRQADKGAPFAPTNLRLYRQTFHGIRDVLAPLVKDGARVLPMQSAAPGKPTLIEICPAVTLKEQGLHRRPFKGRRPERAAARAIILSELEHEQRGLIASVTPEVREAALADTEGDALDAIIAAATACRVLRSGALNEEATKDELERIEGRLYV